ncbi:hypothetical protein BDN71DRAFT_1507666 [Pleurotus eryngii]|uniref:Uncharacterized protein n=1 Tax=Pleurotus eryngii TaxID=5323 RepID=A0A9P5ZY01_PLEER|nr:hypothetical protein BDN71DRAFT_1507666 [Pleurotus eryngii]
MSFTPNSPYSPTSSLDDIAHPTSQAYMRTPSDLPAMHHLPSLSRSDFRTSREDDYDSPAPTANRLMPNSQRALPQGMSRVNEDSGYSTPVLSRSDFHTSREDDFNSPAPMGNRLMSSSQHTLPQGMSRISEDSGYNMPIPHGFPAGSCVSDGSGYSNSPTPASLPTATQGETPMVIPPLIIDRMAKDMGLDNEHRNNLHGFVHLGSQNGALTQADLGTRTYMLATIYQDMAERRRHEQANPTNTLAKLINDLQTRLDDTFALTKEQKDVLYQSTCTAFKTLHIDVERQIKERQTELKCTNIFGSPAREKLFHAKTKRICSSVRNAFRQDLRDSIIGNKKCSLEVFTLATAAKYKCMGIGEAVSKADMIHNALLRDVAYKNRSLLSIDETSGDEDDGGGEPAPKKRRHRGRVPKSEDFWLRVDAYFTTKLEANGRNLSSPKWKEDINTVLAHDKAMFDVDVETEDRAIRGAPLTPAPRPGRPVAVRCATILPVQSLIALAKFKLYEASSNATAFHVASAPRPTALIHVASTPSALQTVSDSSAPLVVHTTQLLLAVIARPAGAAHLVPSEVKDV